MYKIDLTGLLEGVSRTTARRQERRLFRRNDFSRLTTEAVTTNWVLEENYYANGIAKF
jgi:hypothetical protein